MKTKKYFSWWKRSENLLILFTVSNHHVFVVPFPSTAYHFAFLIFFLPLYSAEIRVRVTRTFMSGILLHECLFRPGKLKGQEIRAAWHQGIFCCEILNHFCSEKNENKQKIKARCINLPFTTTSRFFLFKCRIFINMLFYAAVVFENRKLLMLFPRTHLRKGSWTFCHKESISQKKNSKYKENSLKNVERGERER